MAWSININIIKCIYWFWNIELLLPVVWIEEWLSFLGLLLCARHLQYLISRSYSDALMHVLLFLFHVQFQLLNNLSEGTKLERV